MPSSSASTKTPSADPDAGRSVGEVLGLGERMAAARDVADLARQVVLRVEVGGARQVPALVGVPRPAVDEHASPERTRSGDGEGPAPRTSGTARGARRRSGRRSSAHTITVGPDPESVAPRAPAGRRRRGGRGGSATGGTARGAGRRAPPRTARGRRPRSPRPSMVARPTLNVASRCSTVAGSACRESAVAHAPGRDDRDRGQRQVVGDPRHLPVPRERDAAEERRREVVGVALEREPGRQQLLRPAAPAPTRPGRARSPRRTSRARARAGSG